MYYLVYTATTRRFPNDACEGSSGRNGTCYTEAECNNKGGSNAGSCAQVMFNFSYFIILAKKGFIQYF